MTNKENPFMDIIKCPLNIALLKRFRIYMEGKGEINVRNTMIKADRILNEYIASDSVDDFGVFWETKQDNLSPLEQDLVLYFLLVHSSQNLCAMTLIGYRDKIIELLGEVDPLFTEVITKQIVHIPEAYSSALDILTIWKTLRYEAFAEDELLRDYAHHSGLHSNSLMPDASKLLAEKLYVWKKDKKGPKAVGLKAVLTVFGRMLYINCLDQKIKRETTLDKFMQMFGKSMNVDLSNHSQIFYDTQKTKWFNETKDHFNIEE